MFFFFFKQKTAYEMRISDWSSDVCSSDLPQIDVGDPAIARGQEAFGLAQVGGEDRRRQARRDGVVLLNRRIKVVIAHHIKDGRERLFEHRPDLPLHLHQPGLHIETRPFAKPPAPLHNADRPPCPPPPPPPPPQ